MLQYVQCFPVLNVIYYELSSYTQINCRVCEKNTAKQNKQ
jgi:hypothetical protein